jgi:FixJ family two-component response regulator
LRRGRELGRSHRLHHRRRCLNSELDTRVAESSRIAIGVVCERARILVQAQRGRPSCLVLDLRLPGVNGLDFQRKLNEAGVCIPIIFITGHGDIPMTVKAMKSGAVEFLTKPFRDEDLLDAIQQALERDRVRRQQQGEVADLRKRYEARGRGTATGSLGHAQ